MSDVPHEVPYEQLPELTKEARNWAMFCHLAGLLGLRLPIVGHLVGIVGTLVIWQLKRDDHPFIDDQGKEAVNFQISMLIYSVILFCTIIGIALLFVLWIAEVVLIIIAAIKAGEGEAYRYPLTLRLIK
jgi:uncharacterized protein